MTADEFGNKMAKGLKDRGFKKKKLNWYKHEKQLTILFYIQKSYWGNDTWYYCFGIAINALHNSIGYTIAYYDIGTRFDQQLKIQQLPSCLYGEVINAFGETDMYDYFYRIQEVLCEPI